MPRQGRAQQGRQVLEEPGRRPGAPPRHRPLLPRGDVGEGGQVQGPPGHVPRQDTVPRQGDGGGPVPGVLRVQRSVPGEERVQSRGLDQHPVQHPDGVRRRDRQAAVHQGDRREPPRGVDRGHAGRVRHTGGDGPRHGRRALFRQDHGRRDPAQAGVRRGGQEGIQGLRRDKGGGGHVHLEKERGVLRRRAGRREVRLQVREPLRKEQRAGRCGDIVEENGQADERAGEGGEPHAPLVAEDGAGGGVPAVQAPVRDRGLLRHREERPLGGPDVHGVGREDRGPLFHNVPFPLYKVRDRRSDRKGGAGLPIHRRGRPGHICDDEEDDGRGKGPDADSREGREGAGLQVGVLPLFGQGLAAEDEARAGRRRHAKEKRPAA